MPDLGDRLHRVMLVVADDGVRHLSVDAVSDLFDRWTFLSIAWATRFLGETLDALDVFTLSWLNRI